MAWLIQWRIRETGLHPDTEMSLQALNVRTNCINACRRSRAEWAKSIPKKLLTQFG
ncbi:hypothetical protein GCM10008949_49640 [Deinococcus humi]|nr:hypothetical protein GCM10008949_49640 [Deinococcus humi]